MKQKILVVEDEAPLLTGLVDLLEGEGYAVFQATDGKGALERFESECPDLILLDVMIPEMNGYDVCRRIRMSDALIPVLMLTAKGQEIDKVVGLEIGADDYIVKPFGINELLARIRAALRRRYAGSNAAATAIISFGNVTVDPKTLKGASGTSKFNVTPREVKLLQLFMEHGGEVIHRFVILDKIWGVRYEGTTRTLDQHIAKLRQKIETDPASPKHILTVHGVGYRFVAS
jgi:DNA-binding response OmpR family regulator